MRLRRGLRPALVSAAAAAACLTLTAPAVAADPAGNNGTVKIDEVKVDDGPANNPHVPCNFDVSFYNFDKDQEATITFTIHPPSGQETVLLTETKTVSDDEAGGGKDKDAVFTYSGADFGLDRFKRQAQQGYHVKLDILSEGVPGGQKHKVFWLDCAAAGEDNPPSSGASETTPAAPSTSPAGGGRLPLTGPQTALIGLVGLVLLAGGAGATLVWMRRRRDNVTFVS